MNQGSSCLPCPKTQGLTSSSAGSESRVLSARSNQVKVCESSTSTAMKVKRWKTKKERNHAKFKSHKETFQKKVCPKGFLQSCDMHSRLSCLKMIQQPAMKDTCNLKQVFITQSRLTQHQGIFNREVKSINIGRLVNQPAEVEPAKSCIGNVTTQSEGKTPQSHVTLNLDLIPTSEKKDQEALPFLNHNTPEILVQIPKPAPNTQQGEDKENSESCLQSDNNHPHITPSGSGTRISPAKRAAPVLEAAEDILNMLRSHSLFPGRNLVKDTRQSIVEKVRQLYSPNPKLSTGSVRRKLDHSHKADAHKYKDPRWERVSEGGMDVRKHVQRPQSAQRHTSSIHFMPLSRDSPAHTLIKMVSPQDQQKITDVLHQPVNYGPGYKPSHQYQRIIAENSQNMCNITSSSNDRKQDRNTSTFCRARRPGKVHNASLNADSPEVRWKCAPDDFQTHLSYSHNVHQHKFQFNPEVSEHERVMRQPLEDISLEQLIKTGRSVRGSSSGENQTSFDVLCSIWSRTAQKSPIAKGFDASTPETRSCYVELSPHRTHTTSNVESHRSGFPEMLEARSLVAPGNSQLEEVWGFGNTKRRASSRLGADMGLHHGMLPTKTMPRWRNFSKSRYNVLWSPPSPLREEPMCKISVENACGAEWNSSEDWTHGTSHIEQHNQRRKMSMMMSPYSQSSEQENSMISLPYGRSLRKALLDRRSPDAWVYPRMKLY